MAKNITIAVDEDLARRVRVEAARAGKSVSRFVAELLRDRIERPKADGWEGNPQLGALKTFLSGPALQIAVNGRMPTAEERNVR